MVLPQSFKKKKKGGADNEELRVQVLQSHSYVPPKHNTPPPFFINIIYFRIWQMKPSWVPKDVSIDTDFTLTQTKTIYMHFEF
jgi:hypothetical protein